MRRLLYILSKCAPESVLLSYSCELCHSSNAAKLRPPPSGSLGFGTPVRTWVCMTAIKLAIFHADHAQCQIKLPVNYLKICNPTVPPLIVLITLT